MRICVHAHEVYKRDGAIGGFKIGLEDKSVVAIAAGHFRVWIGGSNQPAAMLGRAKQRCQTCRRVKAGPAQPINRAVAAHESGGLAITNNGVVFYPQRHSVSDIREFLAASAFAEQLLHGLHHMLRLETEFLLQFLERR